MLQRTKPIDMRWQWLSFGIFLCVICASLHAGSGAPSIPADTGSTERAAGPGDTGSSPMNFEIPAQPLADALDRYAGLTHRPVVYPGDLAAGRMASAVHGWLTPEAALHMLLQGSGVSARKLRTPAGETFVLSEIPAVDDGSPQGSPSLLANPQGFQAQVQAGILSALCADPNTTPGNYSALFQFRLDAEGYVRDVRLLDPTGSPSRDAAIVSVLAQLRMAPPSRPLAGRILTMAVLLQGPNVRAQCPSGMRAN
ncbi:Ferripyoverdine receptor [Pandoraea anapnoica]|uniref:Ferripyoverdine receptor n=1 Tax=Pandoraea anapnoica TaxID=2508301 RepID=A0A5E5ARQ9_9BURK|nr:STN domain-containing protein [Pandoraea anapnoica]VVE75255.1 Ferripyoverdine receptor [Pandoraea anapnoica]